MKSKNCIVVSACKKYIPELCALLSSMNNVGNKEDVFVIGYQLPKEFTDQFSKLSYKVILYDIPETEARQFGGESEILCRKRYWYAAEWGKEYKSVLLLDADMVFVRSVDNFFKIAEKTNLILGVTLEQKNVYGTDDDGHNHQRVNGIHLVKTPTWNDKDICCTPMFINAKTYESQLKKAWNIFAEGWPNTNFKAPDQQALNMILVAEGLTDKVVLLPNMCWVSSNEKLCKPYTRVTTQRDGLLWTESGEPIFIIHGRYYTKKWRRQQLRNRHHCASGYLKATECSDNMAQGAMNCLYEFFKKNLNGIIKVDTTKGYTVDGFPNHVLDEIGEKIV